MSSLDQFPINEHGTAYQQCQRKRAYCTRKHAHAHAVARRFGQTVYRCKLCKRLHLTSRRRVTV